MLRRKPPFGTVWDFETSDFWIYQRFLAVLKMFDVIPLEEYAVFYDSSSCRFCCTKTQRIQIEYVLRRAIQLNPRYLLDSEEYQDRQRRREEEHYVIF